MRAEDRRVVEGDPTLPGLALALDDEALLRWLLGRWPDDGLVAARTRYLRYKPGTAMIVGVDLTTVDGSVLPALARFVAADGRPKLGKAARRSDSSDPFPAMVDTDALGVVAPAIADPKLPGLRSLLRARRHSVEVLRYKPERRLVARAGPHRLVKAHRPDRARAADTAHQRLAAAGAAVPPRIGADRRRGLVTTRWIEGEAANRLSLGPDIATRCGEAIGALHRLDVPGLLPRPSMTPILRAAAEGIAAAVPSLAGPAQRLALQLDERLATPVIARPVHGDFSADQVVIRPDGTMVLVDVDGAHLGDPADDLASYLAATAVGHGSDRAELESLRGAVLEGWGRTAPPERTEDLCERLDDHLAAALLRRGAEPFRTRHPRWEAEVRRLLALASDLAGGAPAAGPGRRRASRQERA